MVAPRQRYRAPSRDTPTLDLAALAGIVEHTPEECTFTALAGTRISDIERLLAQHGQYLPFDPPLALAGATLGGTVAAGVNGSCRYRYGGARDFLIGARIVDGRGRLTRSGGKVVKNAAGFLLHQALVGSCGTLGILAELTFKVFPAAEAHATVRVDGCRPRVGDGTHGHGPDGPLRSRSDRPRAAWNPVAAARRVSRGARHACGGVSSRRWADASEILAGDDDAAVWRDAREFAWAPRNTSLVRVPIAVADAAAARCGVVAIRCGAAIRRGRQPGARRMARTRWTRSPTSCAALASRARCCSGTPGQPLHRRRDAQCLRGTPTRVMDPDARFS